jgi:6-phosphogluconate dehydrogenase (decarboxylating)
MSAIALALWILSADFAHLGEADFQDRLLSAMRLGFGGHLEKGPRR